MLPNQLSAADFAHYPPLAKQMATNHIALLQQLPLAFLPLLLREIIAYDWKFPAERKELDNQLAYLSSLSAEQFRESMSAFAALRLSSQLETVDWINQPLQFSEQLTAHLWATHQIDAFRAASIEYVHKLNTAAPPEPLQAKRLGMVIVGQGVAVNKYPLFRKLRPEGVYFHNVRPENGRELLVKTLAARAAAYPVAFGHWYIDGGNEGSASPGLTCMSYGSLDTVRSALVTKMRNIMQRGGAGPEALRTMLAEMRPEDLGLNGDGAQAILNRFQVSILTEGSGTQLFSTTFVQWSAREALRRAQPLTLLARFTARQREQSMRELLAGTQQRPVPDPEGSLIDADMGAYYTWINQERLSGADQAGFLVWFEDHHEALAIAPSLPRGSEDGSPIDLGELVSRLV
ncbi:MAG: hypothetical protein JOY62_16605 [Acidobacteriaceae bacterium]|nr:hypothetical protein [Acidobacteriaceae bacterium]MBV9295788.1 hypothetical protein [Acidobacteriaceae bacterium]MBV9781586.1 hypothetical protein [Acidobacteriaceae bacterium]